MSNYLTVTAEFERQKNIKAAAYTLGISGALLLIFMLVKMTIQVPDTPPKEEAIEINIGNGDQGSGKDQPLLPGEPAPAQQTAYVPPQPVESHEESVKDVEANETHESAPTIIKPTITKPEATKINAESKAVKTNTAPQPVVAPPAPRPRALMGQMRGGNGSGGNGADSYKPGTGEGIAGGQGDQGRVGGSPTGTSYTGTPRRIGTVRTVSIPTRDFQDDFKESGKVMLDISVDENGRLLAATYQPRGSSISNRSQIAIAQRRAGELKYPQYPGGFKQALQFDFEVKN
jgi:periplasmic protein TonB